MISEVPKKGVGPGVLLESLAEPSSYDAATAVIFALSLHDRSSDLVTMPVGPGSAWTIMWITPRRFTASLGPEHPQGTVRAEAHTSVLQSPTYVVCTCCP